jgi:hypothetical protein
MVLKKRLADRQWARTVAPVAPERSCTLRPKHRGHTGRRKVKNPNAPAVKREAEEDWR